MILRDQQISLVSTTEEWDFLIIGGGASGLGIAIDAASRGFKTILFEGSDFAKGTSSKSTKLAHGGVRYLAQGDFHLVIEALHERGLLSKNAKHLFKNQKFIIPNYKWWKGYYYTLGLKIYDLLSIKLSLGKSALISKSKVKQLLPTINLEHLKNGTLYHDGQFDDARLAINLAQTAIKQKATILNYFKVNGLLKNKEGIVNGVTVCDKETKIKYNINSKCVINATGILTDKILKLNNPQHKKSIVASQGVHLVLDQSFLDSDCAIMIPKTTDGRVLFIIPWYSKIIVGTTDTPVKKKTLDPIALKSEIEFILQNTKNYLNKEPKIEDIKSVFAGLRPLAAPKNEHLNTKEVSRSHKIICSESQLISIVGGKWTTYRKMAEDVIDKAIEIKNFNKIDSNTAIIEISGNINNNLDNSHLKVYGNKADALKELENSNLRYSEKIHVNYNYSVAQIIWAIRYELARTVEDVLARRIRLLFLDAQAAIDSASKVAEIMAIELKKDKTWEEEQVKEFLKVAKTYLISYYYA